MVTPASQRGAAPMSVAELEEVRRSLRRFVERELMPFERRAMSDAERAAELPLKKLWRDQRSFRITEGPTEVLRTALAKLILRGAMQ